MKKNRFLEETRQSKIAILFMFYKNVKLYLWRLLPIILVFFIGKTGVPRFIVIMCIVGLMFFSLIMGILHYFNFKFYIQGKELLIKKGVFKKTKLNIPFERIQTINLQQNIVLQIFDKVKVEIDTAGSSKKEFVFDALSKNLAQDLRNYILDYKIDIPTEKDEFVENAVEKQQLQNKSIFRHTFGELLLIGLTENHLKALAWILGLMGYFYSQLNEFDFFKELIFSTSNIDYTDFGFQWVTIFIFFALCGLVLISVLRIVLRYFNLEMFINSNGFKISYGLFETREVSVPLQKIQKFSWGDNPLKRIFHIYTSFFHLAQSQEGSNRKKLTIPIMPGEKLHTILDYIFDVDDSTFEKYRIDRFFLYRNIIFRVAIPSVIFSIPIVYFEKYFLLVLIVLFVVYSTIVSIVRYRKLTFEINGSLFRINKGIYGNFREMLYWNKVQNVVLKQSFFQRRKNLASITFHTASGSVFLPYIDIGIAEKLRDYALFKAENYSKTWM